MKRGHFFESSLSMDEELLAFCREVEEELLLLSAPPEKKKKKKSRASATRARCLAGDCCVFSINYSREFKFGDHAYCAHACVHRCGVAPACQSVTVKDFPLCLMDFQPGPVSKLKWRKKRKGQKNCA